VPIFHVKSLSPGNLLNYFVRLLDNVNRFFGGYRLNMIEQGIGVFQAVAASPRRTQPPGMPTAEQIRAARALLRWNATRLAREAGVAVSTVARCEAGSGIPPVGVPILQKILGALEGAGVDFISGGNGPGVRLRRRL
jgi:hypothetical protein